jgi:CRISPR-associated protein Csb2
MDKQGGPEEAEREALSGGPQAFCWRLIGDSLPSLVGSLRLGEAARAAVYRTADMRGLLPLPDRFHRGSDSSHSHAFWLPNDFDHDGLIDHVLLFAASGLPESLLPVLAEGGLISLRGIGRWRLSPVWMGHRAPGPVFGPSCRWVTATPYVTPLRRGLRGRGRGGVERAELQPREQLRKEVVERRLPATLTEIRLVEDASHYRPQMAACRFSLSARGRTPSGDAVAVDAELGFAEPVWGPLAFGFGAHFGLGLFQPTDVASSAL